MDDGQGNYSCQQACTTNAQCSGANGCCALLANGTGACQPPSANVRCRCGTSADCTAITGKSACVPSVDNGVVVAKSYECRPNDGKAGNGCNGSTTCGSGYDCMVDTSKNQFCTLGCATDATCGNPGVGCCKPAGCDNAISSCKFPNACMPC